jgi:hypothetical protein
MWGDECRVLNPTGTVEPDSTERDWWLWVWILPPGLCLGLYGGFHRDRNRVCVGGSVGGWL